MIMLVGDTRDKKHIEILKKFGWGRTVISTRIRPYPGEPWGFDNGAFRDWKQSKNFDVDAYLRRLDMAYCLALEFHRPYLAVVPDIVAGGLRSLEFSLSWLEKLPAGWPWYLAVQDGMTLDDVEPVLDKFAGIFLGGTDKFKKTAWYWRNLAHKHGKKFHYARAGTPRKVLLAKEVGADSVDSAFPMWLGCRLEEFINVFYSSFEQLKLWGPEVKAVRPEELKGKSA